MSYTRAQVDAALQEKALRDHNAGVERAREEYEHHPITSPSHPCATCDGHAYGPGGQCIRCQKEDAHGPQ